MASPKTDGEEENEAFNSQCLMFREHMATLNVCAALLACITYTSGWEKEVEELVREYDGSCVSAVPKDCLKTIMLWTGFSSFALDSIPFVNWFPVQAVKVAVVFIAVAFHGSLLGLLMKRNFPKLSFYSGYVSLISLLFALGMIAFFTVMWVFERN